MQKFGHSYQICPQCSEKIYDRKTLPEFRKWQPCPKCGSTEYGEGFIEVGLGVDQADVKPDQPRSS